MLKKEFTPSDQERHNIMFIVNHNDINLRREQMQSHEAFAPGKGETRFYKHRLISSTCCNIEVVECRIPVRKYDEDWQNPKKSGFLYIRICCECRRIKDAWR